MTTTLPETESTALSQAVVASYLTHQEAETAVRRLSDGGVPMEHISIVGRNFETQDEVHGFYHPRDTALDGAGFGSWFGGIFGLMLGAVGFFVFPGVGAFAAIGPLSGLIAGAVGGAGVGALLNGLAAAGIRKEEALKYQDRLKAGEFLVVVHAVADETTRAHRILADTGQTDLQTHGADA